MMKLIHHKFPRNRILRIEKISRASRKKKKIKKISVPVLLFDSLGLRCRRSVTQRKIYPALKP